MQYVHFFCFLFYMAILVYVLSQNSRAVLNRLYAWIFASFAWWSLCKVFIHNNAVTKETVIFFDSLASFGWGTFSAIFLWAVFVFTEKMRIVKSKLLFLLCFLPSALIIYLQCVERVFVQDFVKEWYGWATVFKPSIWLILQYTVTFAYLIAALCVLGIFMWHTKNIIKKKQAGIMLISCLSAVVLGIFVDLLLPINGVFAIPDAADVVSLIWLSGIVYTIFKYKFLVITPTIAAEEIISTMNDGYIMLDKEGRIVQINSVAADILECVDEGVYNRPFFSLFKTDASEQEELKRLLETKIIHGNERTIETSKGTNKLVSFSSSLLSDEDGTLVGVVCLIRDLTLLKETERKIEQTRVQLEQTQSQLIQSEKMASIGQLASGVAHEINNPTGFVISNLTVLDQYVQDARKALEAIDEAIAELFAQNGVPCSITDKVFRAKEEINIDYLSQDLPQLVKEAQEGAYRIKRIVANLKDFSHPDTKKFEFIDVHDEIEKALSLTENELKYKCEIVKEFTFVPKVFGNSSLINQVFVNIMINAAQFIEKFGKLTIKTYAVDGSVCIDFIDTGKGISVKDINKVFDPFFSTKEVGQGTGLGLSLAYGIVQRHGGTITVSSKPGEGAVFTVMFPAAEQSAA